MKSSTAFPSSVWPNGARATLRVPGVPRVAAPVRAEPDAAGDAESRAEPRAEAALESDLDEQPTGPSSPIAANVAAASATAEGCAIVVVEAVGSGLTLDTPKSQAVVNADASPRS